MQGTPYIIKLTPEEEQKLQKIISKPKNQYRLIQRCKIIILSSEGYKVKQIAWKLNVSKQTVSKWRERFMKYGIKGLYDEQRSGRPRKFEIIVQYKLMHLSCSKPEDTFKGLTRWSYRKLVAAMIGRGIADKISFTRVMTWLKSMEIKPQKVKYWLKQTDPNFEEKMLKIVKLYHQKPEDGPVISVDERTGIQILTPIHPDKESADGSLIYREFEYKRNGTLSLIGGFDVKTGRIHGIVKEHHKTTDFIEFLRHLMEVYKGETKIYLILDNLSAHKSKELLKWLDENRHPFVFTFLPFHGSWLNQIEIWFGILNKQCLKSAACENRSDMTQLIIDYMETYNEYFAHPFKWQYKKELLKAN